MVIAYEELVDFIAAGTTPQGVIDFRPSEATRERVAELLNREKTTGLTTNEIAVVVLAIIRDFPDLGGLWHIAGPRISKRDLLTLIRDAFGLSTAISPDESVRYDRSLNGTRFRNETGYNPPSWPQMIAALREAGRLT